MRHPRALGFDALEARKLLSRSRVVGPHTTPMIVATPVVVDGTLAVNNSAAISSSNPDGSTTTSTPVSGHLGALGKVRGLWNQTVDEFGDVDGPNVLRLVVPKGGLIITFNTLTAVKAHPTGHGTVYYPRAQEVLEGTGAYAGATESGMIDLTTNHSKSEITSLVLTTAST
jgi:hypothetical protein